MPVLLPREDQAAQRPLPVLRVVALRVTPTRASPEEGGELLMSMLKDLLYVVAIGCCGIVVFYYALELLEMLS